MIYKLPLILLITFSLTVGCSNSSDETPKEHFASDQKRALDKAATVEQLLQDGADQRQRDIEQQTKK